jgi:hypothetical protein
VIHQRDCDGIDVLPLQAESDCIPVVRDGCLVIWGVALGRAAHIF